MIYREYIEPVNDGHEVEVPADSYFEILAVKFSERGGHLEIEGLSNGWFEVRAKCGVVPGGYTEPCGRPRCRVVCSAVAPHLAEAKTTTLEGILETAVRLTEDPF